MPKLRTLSGGDLIRMFARFGFREISRRGSHVKLRRVLVNGVRENLTVPSHDELDRGTLQAIYRQASRYITEAELRSHFYTD
jgi:predicted RNA binding protein YcfA (HicA-like mRNA interferase family)